MSREEALKLLEVRASGADSRLEALGMIDQMRNPDLYLTDGPKVEQAQKETLHKFGYFLNRFGGVLEQRVGMVERFLTSKESGKYLKLERNIALPHVIFGTYAANISIENNPREVEGSGKPLWLDGELLAITIKSKEFPTPDDNYIYEIIIDEKNGGVAFINGGGSAPLDLGDYEILGYLFEDIDR